MMSEAEIDATARANVAEQVRVEYEERVETEKERLRAQERMKIITAGVSSHAAREREEREQI